tara:strand:- start:648 stop:1187 length:540 start_codon:yes stop_codon:yes gene_type:complete
MWDWSWFSDWGTADEYESIGAAETQAVHWFDQVANEKQWTPEDENLGMGLITQAVSDSSTAQGFWANLATSWEAMGNGVDGWDALTDVWAAAAGTAATVAEGREQGTVGAVVEGTVAATQEDLNPYTETVKGAALGALVGAIGLGGTAAVFDKKSAVMGVQSGAVLGALAGAWWTWPDA